MRTGRSETWKQAVAKIAVALALLAAIAGCEKRDKTVPQALIGVWKTSDRKYSDRFFEITKNTITFATGPGASDMYTITEVEESIAGGEVLYTISYSGQDGNEYKLTLISHAANRSRIQFKNQNKITWTKAASRPGN